MSKEKVKERESFWFGNLILHIPLPSIKTKFIFIISFSLIHNFYFNKFNIFSPIHFPDLNSTPSTPNFLPRSISQDSMHILNFDYLEAVQSTESLFGKRRTEI
jgi:hypothetical protein